MLKIYDQIFYMKVFNKILDDFLMNAKKIKNMEKFDARF